MLPVLPSLVGPGSIIWIVFGDVGVDAWQRQLLVWRCRYRLHNQLSIAIRRFFHFWTCSRCRRCREFLQLSHQMSKGPNMQRVTHHVVEVVTAISIIMLRIEVVIVVVARAGGARVGRWHGAGWRRERTLDILQCLLFRNRNLERTIDGVCVLHWCRLATGTVALAVILIHQILKLYSNICTWET